MYCLKAITLGPLLGPHTTFSVSQCVSDSLAASVHSSSVLHVCMLHIEWDSLSGTAGPEAPVVFSHGSDVSLLSSCTGLTSACCLLTRVRRQPVVFLHGLYVSLFSCTGYESAYCLLARIIRQPVVLLYGLYVSLLSSCTGYTSACRLLAWIIRQPIVFLHGLYVSLSSSCMGCMPACCLLAQPLENCKSPP